MGTQARRAIKGAILAILYGCLFSLILAAAVFLVGFIVGGASWARGYEWARRVVYLVGAAGILLGGTSMFTTGGKSREEQLDPNNYMVPEPFKLVPGISWPVALVWGSAGFLATGVVLELVFNALIG